MNGWLREQDTDLGLGNEYRDFNGNTEPFVGLIDEVRISDVARAPAACSSFLSQVRFFYVPRECSD